MKKLTAAVLSLALLAANLAGCSDRNDSESSESKVTETTTTTTTSESKEDTSSENSTTTTEATTTETSKEEDSSSDESTTITTSVTDSSTTSNSTTTASTKANDTTTKKVATTTKTTTAATTQTSTNPKSSNRVVLDVKNIQQKPELPKGSEISATTMLLNYYGINVNKMELVNYLETEELPKNSKGPDPWAVFVGNPKLTTGYGCYSPVIKFTLINYFMSNQKNLL